MRAASGRPKIYLRTPFVTSGCLHTGICPIKYNTCLLSFYDRKLDWHRLFSTRFSHIYAALIWRVSAGYCQVCTFGFDVPQFLMQYFRIDSGSASVYSQLDWSRVHICHNLDAAQRERKFLMGGFCVFDIFRSDCEPTMTVTAFGILFCVELQRVKLIFPLIHSHLERTSECSSVEHFWVWD